MTERKALAPAHRKPCAQCPWRTENQGKRHPHSFYTKANLRRLWRGLRDGERMTCHPTDPTMDEFEGYEATAEREVTHECAGALILIQREIMRFSDAAKEAEAEGAKDGLRRYRSRFPRGLTKNGIAAHLWNAMVAGPTHLTAARPNLNEPGIGHPDIPEWTPRRAEK
jgi:hypothetical protein